MATSDFSVAETAGQYAFLAEHPGDGSVGRYSWADTGLSEAGLRPQAAAYKDRFAGASEPHHYAFTSGLLGDRLITKSDRDPQHFLDAAERIAPRSATRVLRPGEPLTIASAQ